VQGFVISNTSFVRRGFRPQSFSIPSTNQHHSAIEHDGLKSVRLPQVRHISYFVTFAQQDDAQLQCLSITDRIHDYGNESQGPESLLETRSDINSVPERMEGREKDAAPVTSAPLTDGV
jgi:hypothetical protein